MFSLDGRGAGPVCVTHKPAFSGLRDDVGGWFPRPTIVAEERMDYFLNLLPLCFAFSQNAFSNSNCCKLDCIVFLSRCYILGKWKAP